VLCLSRQAEAALLGFADELEPKLGENGDLGHISDWGCKLVGGIGRIAGLLHLAANVRSGWGEPVALDSIQDAIKIGRYLIPHALGAFDLMEADPNLTLARRVHLWITSRQLTSFSRRDCFEAMKGRVRRVEGLDPVLNILEVHGHIRRRPPEARGRGRPPAPVFDVNPLVAKSSLFSQNRRGPHTANSANSADAHAPEGDDSLETEAHGAGGDWERMA
jgi:hypothetical protein